MRLLELLASDASPQPGAHVEASSGTAPQADPEISGLAYDSRRVKPGDLFFCVSGFQSDGHRFAADALAAGAVALVVEHPLGLGVPEIEVDSVRAAMGPLAARFYGEPTSRLRVVGVTGTNGKTTTAYLVRALIEAGGERCGLLGTVKSVVGGLERDAGRTTPEAIDLQADFRSMLDNGESACAMEVSSHALALGRTAGVRFAAAVFTNLTQDHLDFHPTMEDYFLAKRRLFTDASPGVSVVNVGDPYGRRLAEELKDVVAFAVDEDADYCAHEVRCDFSGSHFRLRTPVGERELSLPLPGRFNVANALGALAAVHSLGGDLDMLAATLERGVHVPGRFESIDEGQDFAVIVDYAHTPDSLENVLATARELAQPCRGRVFCVFGAGGDRDQAKRPLMGQAAARLADVAIVTSDNPRSEDPQTIVEQVLAGARRAKRAEGELQSEVDRRAAIETAVARARSGDVVVIAGKGHEQGQEFAEGQKIPFDDATVAREALRARAAAVGPGPTGRSGQGPPGRGRRVG
jgi:UDP-N-acetylmuramoyl-L-alanyl-D-glutamate--2,6-diaminopimelate ligase